ncbi:unnamed protein product [Coregonus sp. 'balchen']|nr:unnamed protein product [Coregonus sp. 'balchen']
MNQTSMAAIQRLYEAIVGLLVLKNTSYAILDHQAADEQETRYTTIINQPPRRPDTPLLSTRLNPDNPQETRYTPIINQETRYTPIINQVEPLITYSPGDQIHHHHQPAPQETRYTPSSTRLNPDNLLPWRPDTPPSSTRRPDTPPSSTRLHPDNPTPQETRYTPIINQETRYTPIINQVEPLITYSPGDQIHPPSSSRLNPDNPHPPGD